MGVLGLIKWSEVLILSLGGVFTPPIKITQVGGIR